MCLILLKHPVYINILSNAGTVIDKNDDKQSLIHFYMFASVHYLK